MKKDIYNELSEKIERLEVVLNGGKGSGNFGHSGRPGEVGGSSSSGSGGVGQGEIDKKIEEAKRRLYDIQDEITAEYDFGGDTSHLESLEQEAEEELRQLKEQKLAEIRDKNRQNRESEISKAKAEREEHVKQIDKIIGSEKITQGKTKAEDDKNYKKLEKDIREIKSILAKEKSRENFGQEEVRKLRDKYSDYMSGNWSVTERFQRSVQNFEDWADNYVNNSLENIITDAISKALNGGKGSGNFGHAGRPGEIGGSAPEGASSSGTNSDAAKDIEREYKQRGEKMEENADEINESIYEGDGTWTGTKEKAMDFIKMSIKTNRDMYDDDDDFKEQSEDLLEDLDYLKGLDAKEVTITENPMSGSGIVIEKSQKNEKLVDKIEKLRDEYYETDEKRQAEIREELSKLQKRYPDIYDSIK